MRQRRGKMFVITKEGDFKNALFLLRIESWEKKMQERGRTKCAEISKQPENSLKTVKVKNLIESGCENDPGN